MYLFQKNVRIFLVATLFVFGACHKPYLENPQNESPTEWVHQNSDFTNAHYVDDELELPLTVISKKNINGTVSGGFIPVGNQMIFATYNGFIYTMNKGTFAKVAHTRPAKGISTRPTLYNTHLYIAAEWIKSGLNVYDFTTKQVIWEDKEGFSVTSPIIHNNRLFIAQKDGVIRCLNPRTFQEIWKFNSNQPILNNLAFDQTFLYALTAKGMLFALVPESGTQAWKVDIGEAIQTSPVILNQYILVTSLSGKLFLINTDTHQSEFFYDMKAPVFQTASASGNLFFIGSSDGHLIAFDPESHKIIWEQTIEGPPSASSLVLKSKLVVGSDQKRLYILNQSDGSIIQELKLNGRMSCLPLVHDNGLILGTDFRKLVFLKKGETE